MTVLKWTAVVGCGLLVVAAFSIPPVIDSRFNKTLQKAPYRASEAAQKLHKTLLVADLHADSLLWGRDLLSRSSHGHLDIPRMQEGNVAIQAFTVVTKTPKRLNINRNSGNSDDIRRLAIMEGWPPQTWNSLLERALYQAGRLNKFAAKSKGEFVVLRSQRDLARVP